MHTATTNRSRFRTRVLFTTFGTIALGLLNACMLLAKPPQNLDYSHTRPSNDGRYNVTIFPAGDSIPKNKLQQWTLHVETAAGAPVDSVRVFVDGGMPQHGHGLPTKPRVTRALGNGNHVVDGMKFNMGGWWEVKFILSAAAGSDVVVFNLKL